MGLGQGDRGGRDGRGNKLRWRVRAGSGKVYRAKVCMSAGAERRGGADGWKGRYELAPL